MRGDTHTARVAGLEAASLRLLDPQSPRLFTIGNVERLCAPLSEWQMECLPVRAGGYSLDLDSTYMSWIEDISEGRPSGPAASEWEPR